MSTETETKIPPALTTAIAEYDPVAAGLADLRARFGGVAVVLPALGGVPETVDAILQGGGVGHLGLRAWVHGGIVKQCFMAVKQ